MMKSLKGEGFLKRDTFEKSRFGPHLTAQQASLFPTVSTLGHPAVMPVQGAFPTAAALPIGLPIGGAASQLDLQPAN